VNWLAIPKRTTFLKSTNIIIVILPLQEDEAMRFRCAYWNFSEP